MNKRLLFNVLCVIALFVAGIGSAKAFPSKNYATTSKLNRGKWVKIAIPEDGIYEITFSELKQMGFTNPQKVNIYGTGGHPINEVLDGKAVDDLQEVPCILTNEKLCFYACGPVEYTIETPTTNPHFTRDMNSCSTAGYYFLTESENSPRQPLTLNYSITGSYIRNSSLDYFHHEQELTSASQSGKEFLGEKINNGTITIPYSLTKLCGDSAIIVNPRAAVKSKNVSYLTLNVNDNNISLTNQESKIYSSSSEYVFYNTVSPVVTVRGQNGASMPATGNITVGITAAIAYSWARLDYCLITYYHNNSLSYAPDNQLRMGFNNVSTKDIIAIDGAITNVQLWNIDNPKEPKNYTINLKDGIKGFTPPHATDYTQFIAFNPSKKLKKIAGFEHIDNQNIHGMAVPDMVIVTCEKLLPQAEIVAQMHRDNDNLLVHVLDQQNIFNEFSSGTPDPMAIRLMNKMFYDRDTDGKFKYLLMFGSGSYDNRQLLAKNPCNIITYESIVSNDENNSFVSDDFFGFLDDNSGANTASDLLRLGVGRIPSASVEEAETDVNKLLNYVNYPDFGSWRNNALFVADYVYGPPEDPSTETFMHESQAEGIVNLISNDLNTGFISNKVYVNQFSKDPSSGFLLEGRKSMNSLLEDGQFFMTYVGHANPTSLTKEVNLWTTNEAKNASYPHLPIITTACCDVARYDGNQRGLMEIMFHHPTGGAIAMLAATRSAYATGNDALNKAFVTNLFCYNNKGRMTTLGEAYMLCKQSFGTATAYNKMMFSLLGDPAMNVYYPKPLFKITKINGKAVGSSNISSGALQQVTVEAQVMTPDGSAVDETFNGDATLSIYDYKKKETTYNNRDIFFPRRLLTEVSGRVENGIFIGRAYIPRYTLNPGAMGLMSVYAHRDNSNDMVNGTFEKIILNSYSETNALTVHDSTPPTIDAIYFNNEQDFEICNTVGPISTLYITASDDYAFNNQNAAIGNSMTLKLDGGKTSITNVKAYSSMSNEGKTLTVEMPLELEPGDHTLQYTVYDIAGNMTTRSLNFGVSSTQQAQLTVEQEPAVDVATFNFSSDLNFTPTVDIKLFDSQGVMKWRGNVKAFPFEWNLNSWSGRLPAGVYTFYGKFNNGTIYGSTPIGTLIIAEEQKIQ
ncbi:MAG: type IX secretion system sortase PorU [Muribaculaceae bacterium]|nr:type IX secretion system sortase PorU [Muribaculaceae bacterium]